MKIGLDIGSTTIKAVVLDDAGEIVFRRYERHRSRIAMLSEVLLHALSAREIFVSSGSACSSHKGRSPVLEHFGLPKETADSTIRLSFSYLNTPAEARRFAEALREIRDQGF